MHPLLLTGPPAVGKSTTAAALAASRPRGAVIEVDDIRRLVVAGHAAPWEGAEGQLQQRVGIENACDIARRLHAVGIDVVLADVVTAHTAGIYRRRLPGLVMVRLRLPLAAARRRAALRPVALTHQEFEALHAADARSKLPVDAVLDVERLTVNEQAEAVLRLWSARSATVPSTYRPLPDTDDVLRAASQRAAALAAGDEARLRALLHPEFSWVSHRGESFDLDSYLASNRRGAISWHGQELRDAEVRVVGDTAVLRCRVVDIVEVGGGEPETFVMPMTQTWVREGGRWLCLAGHAGPRLQATDR